MSDGEIDGRAAVACPPPAPPWYAVPDVVGMNQSAAVAALDAAGFQANVSQAVSTGANIGKVISQTPAAGTIADDGSAVTITVGIAPPTTTTSTATTTTSKPTPPTT